MAPMSDRRSASGRLRCEPRGAEHLCPFPPTQRAPISTLGREIVGVPPVPAGFQLRFYTDVRTVAPAIGFTLALARSATNTRFDQNVNSSSTASG